MRNIFYLVWRNFKRRPFRSGVMLGSIILACAALFTAVALSRGIQSTLQTTRERLGADIVAAPAEALDEAQAALIAGSPSSFYMPASWEEKIGRVPGVSKTSPQLFLRSLDSPCCVAQVALVGYDPERDFTITPWLMQRMAEPLRDNQIIVGAKVISSLIGTPARAVGQRLVFMGKPFTVGMILEPTGLGADYTVFLTMDTAYDMTQGSPLYPVPVQKNQISVILVKLEEGMDPTAVAGEMERLVPEVKAFTASELVSSYARQLHDLADVLFAAGGIFCSLAIILAGSLFTLSVRQRARELGLFWAMGAGKGFIFRLIVLEAICLAGTGGLAGVLLGFCAVFFGRDFIMEMLGNMHAWPGGGQLLMAACATLSAALLTGVLGGLVPARRISLMEPYEAIRMV